MEKILNYQKFDGQIYRLEKKLNDSEYTKKMENEKVSASQIKEKIMILEGQAKQLSNKYDEIQKLIEVNLKNVEILNNQNLDDMDKDKLQDFEQKSELVGKNLSLLQKKLQNLQQQIQRHINEFRKATKSLHNAKREFDNAKQQFEKEKAEIEPEIIKLKEERTLMEKDLPSDLLDKYQKARKDNIYPVFVPLEDKRCGACKMELPQKIIDDLKNCGMVECEQCRKFIYINKD